MRIFLSGLRKLVRRPASWVTGGLLMGLLALIIIAVGSTAHRTGSRPEQVAALALITFPTAYDGVLAFILGLGGLFAVIYGAAVAGSEWTWGTLKAAVARGESRSRYVLASFASITVMIALGLLLTFGVGVLAAFIAANIAGVSTSGVGDPATLERLPRQFALGWLAIVEEGALGYAIATLARSQLAGIGAGIALYFGESFARLFLPDIVKYLPFDVATASVGASTGFGGGGGFFTPLPADPALGLVFVWMIGALLVTAIFTERAEITG
jgi:ABC-type transport system involved in multi-copper enzyme maturation permease subunit